MTRPLLSSASTSVKLIFSALMVAGVWMFFQVLSIVSGMIFYSVGYNEVFEVIGNLQDPGSVAFIKYVQAVTSFGLFIVSSFLIAFIIAEKVPEFLLLEKAPGFFSFLLVSVMIISILPFSNLLTEVNRQLSLPEQAGFIQQFFEEKEFQMEEIMRTFLKVEGFRALLVNILIIAVIPAIGEELLFRGVFQRLFISLTRNPHAGIIITAFIFSALHLQFLSFLPRFFLGALFGYMVYWSHSLWPAIAAHFLNNFLAVLYYYFYYSGRTEIDLEYIGAPGHGLYLGVISAFISAALFWGVYMSLKKDRINLTDSNTN